MYMTPAPDARSLPTTANRRSTSRVGQRRRRLVHQEDAGVGADGLGDLDELLLGQAERVDRALDVDRGAQPLEQRATRLDTSSAS